MNVLDRTIAFFAPQAGLRRAAARAQIPMIARAYDDAGRTNRTSRWRAAARGPVLEVQAARAMVRDRARDVVRNNAWGRRAIAILVANQIGTGIRPRANTGNPELNKAINALWEAWTPMASPSTGLDVYGIQALAARARAESGESLVKLIPTNPCAGTVPLQLQVLETDWLVEDHSSAVMPASPIREGIKFKEDGTRESYLLYKFNPNDYWQAGRNDWLEIPADQIAHLYRIERPGQLRGVSDLATTMMRLHDLDDYHDAALMMAKVQAVLGVFVTQTGGPSGSPLGQASSDDIGRLEELTPGMVGYLRPGEDVKFLAPQASGPFDAYTKAALRAIAMGVGITYHQLTGDLSEANYSSLRAGNIEFRHGIEQDQWLMHIPQMCQPIWCAFIRQAILAGLLPPIAENAPALWAPPRAELVDPSRDTNAIIAQIRAGLITQAQAIAMMGWDPRTQLDEIQAFNKLLDDAGIILDTDPRRISGTGIPNDPAQLAKVELAAKGN